MQQTSLAGLMRIISQAILALCLLVGCSSEPGRLVPDGDAAGSEDYLVGGILTGLRGSVEIGLNGSEFIILDSDGDFFFETSLRTGDAFVVSIVNQPADQRCEAVNGDGVVATDHVLEVVVTCTIRVGLARLATSAPGYFSPAFDPLSSQMQLSVSLLISEIRLTPTAIQADAVITIDGLEIPSGSASSAIPLDLGMNTISIVVMASDGEVRSYVVEVLRGAAAIQQVTAAVSSNPDAQDQFGGSVALSGDLLAIGTAFEDSGATGIDGDQADNSAPESGAVYVFRRSGTAWTQEAYLKASNAESGDRFGAKIALSGDTLVVAAKSEDSGAIGVDGDQADNSAPESGAVYVFRRSGTVWTQEAYLKASNAEESDAFGTSVAVSGDALAVGAMFEGSSARGVNGSQISNGVTASGAAYIFRRTGPNWQQEAYVKASNTDLVDRFGASVSLSGDTLAVGADFEGSDATGVDGDQSSNAAVRSGAVYLFRHQGTVWTQEAYLKASNTLEQGQFGSAMSLSGDTLAVSALGEDSNAVGVDGNQDDHSAPASGAVYVFRRVGITWSQEAYVKASNTEGGDMFGASVSLSGDALAIGAPAEDSDADHIDGDQLDNAALGSGAVYVYRRSDAGWSQEAYVKASASARSNLFGDTVSLSGDALVVGAPRRDRVVPVDGGGSNLLAAGMVYIFQ